MRHTILWSVLYKYDLNTSPSPPSAIAILQAVSRENKQTHRTWKHWRFEESSREPDDFSPNPIHHPEQLGFPKEICDARCPLLASGDKERSHLGSASWWQMKPKY